MSGESGKRILKVPGLLAKSLPLPTSKVQSRAHGVIFSKATAMESPDLGLVQKAADLVNQVIEGRYHATAAVPYFAPTNIGTLTPSMQEAELRIAEETAYGNRVRASVQLALEASAASLRICESLMKDSSEVVYEERLSALQSLAKEAEAARSLSDHAGAILSGKVLPKADSMTEMRRLSGATFQRFSRRA